MSTKKTKNWRNTDCVTKYLREEDRLVWEQIKSILDEFKPILRLKPDRCCISLTIQSILKNWSGLKTAVYEFVDVGNSETLDAVQLTFYENPENTDDPERGSIVRYNILTGELVVNGWQQCDDCAENVCNPVPVGDGQLDETYSHLCSKCLDKHIRANKIEYVNGRWWWKVGGKQK